MKRRFQKRAESREAYKRRRVLNWIYGLHTRWQMDGNPHSAEAILRRDLILSLGGRSTHCRVVQTANGWRLPIHADGRPMDFSTCLAVNLDNISALVRELRRIRQPLTIGTEDGDGGNG